MLYSDKQKLYSPLAIGPIQELAHCHWAIGHAERMTRLEEGLKIVLLAKEQF